MFELYREAMRFLSPSSPRFFSQSREHSGLFPFVWWPSVSSQKRVTGPALITKCITISWGRSRWHLFWGRVGSPFPGPLSAPELGLPEFVVWFRRWANKSISVAEVASWAQRSGWDDVIRWGGARTWYGRLVIGRAFLATGSNDSLSDNVPSSFSVFSTLRDEEGLDDVDIRSSSIAYGSASPGKENKKI
jgi:hypothetical protein